MARRLNDTRAIAAAPLGSEQNVSISVEKCGEGFLVRESTYGPGCDYKSHQRYYETAPKIVPPRVSRSGPQRDAAGSRGLSDTMDYLKD
jgi:hypothetical protein